MDRGITIGHMAAGVLICLGSCIFTCNFVLLGTPTPTLNSGAWEILLYFAKLAGGCSVSAAQIFGLIIHMKTGDRFMLTLYRVATTASIFMSVCAFHSMLQTGSVNVDRVGSIDAVIGAQRDHVIKSLGDLRGQRNRALAVFSGKADKLSEQIEGYEDKLEVIATKMTQQNDVAMAQDQVSAGNTYESIANDFVAFWCLTDGVAFRIELFLTYVMLFTLAALMDLTGTHLIALSIKNPELKAENQNATMCGAELQLSGGSGGEKLDDFSHTTMCRAESFAPVGQTDDFDENEVDEAKYDNHENTDICGGAESGAKGRASSDFSRNENDDSGYAKMGGAESPCPDPDSHIHSELLTLGVTPELESEIIEACRRAESINKVQDIVWDTGKSSTRGKMVNAVMKAHGIKLKSKSSRN